jgi:hypothetical protein
VFIGSPLQLIAWCLGVKTDEEVRKDKEELRKERKELRK